MQKTLFCGLYVFQALLNGDRAMGIPSVPPVSLDLSFAQSYFEVGLSRISLPRLLSAALLLCKLLFCG